MSNQLKMRDGIYGKTASSKEKKEKEKYKKEIQNKLVIIEKVVGGQTLCLPKIGTVEQAICLSYELVN